MEINCLVSSGCSVPSDAKIANAEEWAEEIGRDEEAIHDRLEGILPNIPSVCSATHRNRWFETWTARILSHSDLDI